VVVDLIRSRAWLRVRDASSKVDLVASGCHDTVTRRRGTPPQSPAGCWATAPGGISGPAGARAARTRSHARCRWTSSAAMICGDEVYGSCTKLRQGAGSRRPGIPAAGSVELPGHPRPTRKRPGNHHETAGRL